MDPGDSTTTTTRHDEPGSSPKRQRQAAPEVAAAPAHHDHHAMEEEDYEDEDLMRVHNLFYNALDSAVVSSGMLHKTDIYRLSQVCRSITRIIRQRVVAIGGAPKVLEEVHRFPGTRKLNVAFFQPFINNKRPLNSPCVWRVPISLAPGDLSQFQTLTIRVEQSWKRTKSNTSRKQWKEVEDPFELLRPFIPPHLTSLSLAVHYAPSKAKEYGSPGLNNIILHSPLQSLLHLTITARQGMGTITDALWPAIEQHRFPHLQSLRLTLSNQGSMLRSHDTDPAKLLRGIASRRYLPHLKSFTYRGTLLRRINPLLRKDESAILCLLNAKDVDLARFTQFAVHDNLAYKQITKFLQANDPTWTIPLLGATMLTSSDWLTTATNKGSDVKIKDVCGGSAGIILDSLLRGLVGGPSCFRLRFLQTITGFSDNVGTLFIKHGPTGGLSEDWEGLLTTMAPLVMHVQSLEPSGHGPLTQHLFKWLASNHGGPPVICKHLFQHHPSTAESLLSACYGVLLRTVDTSSANPVRIAAATSLINAIDALPESDAKLVERAIGSGVGDLLISFLRTRLPLSSKAMDNLSHAIQSHMTVLGDPIRQHALQSEVCVLMLNHPPKPMQELQGRRIKTSLWVHQPVIMFNQELTYAAAEVLLARPSRVENLCVVLCQMVSNNGPEGKPTFASSLVDYLLEPSRWDRLWHAVVEQCSRQNRYLTGYREGFLHLLRAAHSRNLANNISIRAKAKHDLVALLDFDRLRQEGGASLVDWIVRTWWDGPCDYLDSLLGVILARLKRMKNGRVVGMTNTLVEQLLVASVIADKDDNAAVIFPEDHLEKVLDVWSKEIVSRLSKMLDDCTYREGDSRHWVNLSRPSLIYEGTCCLVRRNKTLAGAIANQELHRYYMTMGSEVRGHFLWLTLHSYEKSAHPPIVEATFKMLSSLCQQWPQNMARAIMRLSTAHHAGFGRWKPKPIALLLDALSAPDPSILPVSFIVPLLLPAAQQAPDRINSTGLERLCIIEHVLFETKGALYSKMQEAAQVTSIVELALEVGGDALEPSYSHEKELGPGKKVLEALLSTPETAKVAQDAFLQSAKLTQAFELLSPDRLFLTATSNPDWLLQGFRSPQSEVKRVLRQLMAIERWVTRLLKDNTLSPCLLAVMYHHPELMVILEGRIDRWTATSDPDGLKEAWRRLASAIKEAGETRDEGKEAEHDADHEEMKTKREVKENILSIINGIFRTGSD